MSFRRKVLDFQQAQIEVNERAQQSIDALMETNRSLMSINRSLLYRLERLERDAGYAPIRGAWLP